MIVWGFDSLNVKSNVNFKIIKEKFRDADGNKINWEFKFLRQPQEQTEFSNDCGVFAIYYALRFILNEEKSIVVKQVSKFINKNSILNKFFKGLTDDLRSSIMHFLQAPNHDTKIIKRYQSKLFFCVFKNCSV